MKSLNEKMKMCQRIADYFGGTPDNFYYLTGGSGGWCINTTTAIFKYFTIDELLKDWLFTLEEDKAENGNLEWEDIISYLKEI